MIVSSPVGADERFAVEELYAEYAAVLDERRFDEWPLLFTQDCLYQVVPRENEDRGLPLATLSFESRGMLLDRVYGITQTLYHQPYYQRHLIGPLAVRRADDGALGVRTNYLVISTKAGALSEVYNAGRYDDLVVWDGERLRFRQKRCIFDSELIPNSLIYPI